MGSLWQSTSEWLLPSLFRHLDEGSDDVYFLWLIATEHALLQDPRDSLLLLPTHKPLSRRRAHVLAIVHSCWKALFQLPEGTVSVDEGLNEATVDYILRQVEQASRPLQPHPYRRRAMCLPLSPDIRNSQVMLKAVENGYLEVVVWLQYVQDYKQGECLRYAAEIGHHHIVSWILDNAQGGIEPVQRHQDDPELGLTAWRFRPSKFNWHYVVVNKSNVCIPRDSATVLGDVIAKNGSASAMLALLDHSLFKNTISKTAAIGAAAAGHQEVVECLLKHRPYLVDIPIVFVHALRGGHINIVKWLVVDSLIQRQYLSLVKTWAAINDKEDMAQWIIQTQACQAEFPNDEPLPFTVADAAQAGDIPLTWWFVEEHKHPLDCKNVIQAIEGGETEAVKWMVRRMCSLYGFIDWACVLWKAVERDNEELVRFFVGGLGACDSLVLCRSRATAKIMSYLYEIATTRSPPRPLQFSRQIRILGLESFGSVAWLLRHGFTERYLFDWHVNQTAEIARKYEKFWQDDSMITPRLPSLSRMQSFHEMLALMIERCSPDFVRQLDWLPLCAIRVGRLDWLKSLLEIGHPEVLRPKNIREVIRETKDDAIAMWLVQQKHDLFSSRLVDWAVKYDKRAFLRWVFRKFLPVQTAAPPERLRRQCRETLFQAVETWGRVELLNSLLACTSCKIEIFSKR